MKTYEEAINSINERTPFGIGYNYKTGFFRGDAWKYHNRKIKLSGTNFFKEENGEKLWSYLEIESNEIYLAFVLEKREDIMFVLTDEEYLKKEAKKDTFKSIKKHLDLLLNKTNKKVIKIDSYKTWEEIKDKKEEELNSYILYNDLQKQLKLAETTTTRKIMKI